MDMDLAGLFDFLRDQPLLLLAMAAIFVSVLGGMIKRASPALGGALRGLGTLGLVGAMLLTIAQVARLTTGSDFALPQVGLPKQTVEGVETRIPMSRDNHFWLDAEVNGRSHRFLVDTGATLPAIGTQTAVDAQVPELSFAHKINMRTANGNVQAEVSRIDELRLGNIVARDLDVVVAPGLGSTNVLGMNFLSRLKGWKVEDQTLILTPNNPQPVVEDS